MFSGRPSVRTLSVNTYLEWRDNISLLDGRISTKLPPQIFTVWVQGIDEKVFKITKFEDNFMLMNTTADQVSLWNSMTHSVSATLTWTLLTTDRELDAFPNCCPTIVSVVPPATGPLTGSNYQYRSTVRALKLQDPRMRDWKCIFRSYIFSGSSTISIVYV